jgi:hypothetical protein
VAAVHDRTKIIAARLPPGGGETGAMPLEKRTSMPSV